MIRAGQFQWLPSLGIGYLAQAAPFEYGSAYFEHYVALADSDIGQRLNLARFAMLDRHRYFASPMAPEVVDVGIGAGTFVEIAECMGYDVNPRGVAWLKERNLYRDPYAEPVDVACFWDALEHIDNPSPLLNNVRHRVLVSLPIFHNAAHALASKHFKPDEHIWYFTDRGFRWFMQAHGWTLLESNTEETYIGREGIVSYAFGRV